MPRNGPPGHVGISPRVPSERAPGSARNTQLGESQEVRIPFDQAVKHVLKNVLEDVVTPLGEGGKPLEKAKGLPPRIIVADEPESPGEPPREESS